MVIKLYSKISGAFLLVALVLAVSGARAERFELRQGFDMFARAQSPITSLHSLSLLHEVRPGLYFGQSLYSAAGGNGGGLFIGGFEVLKRLPLSERISLEFGGFIGGGGGAEVVIGDGLMSRVHATVLAYFADGLAGFVGVSYIDITGSPISTPALSFGVTTGVDYALSAGHHAPGRLPASGLVISAFKPLARTYFPVSSTGRHGLPIGQMYLLGAEVSFANPEHDSREVFMRAAGAVAGDGAGYAEWLLGYRWLTRGERFRLFGELGAGFAGGGNVDTGGGLIGAAGLGFSARLFGNVEAELGVSAVAALDGDFRALAGFARTVLRFGNGTQPSHAPPRHWQLSLGMAAQLEHPGYRRPGASLSGSPILAETSLDLFLTEQIYLTGNAQTVMLGNAGGYAVGLFGFGYEQGLGARWALSGEVYVGAAAGGGINTGGGLIAGTKLELDYALSEGLKLSVGAGKMISLGDASPVTLHFGIKLPFTTYH